MTLTDMAERGARSTPDTWPQARRVEVARHVLTTARVPEMVTEVERLREIERCARGVVRTAHREVTKRMVVDAWWNALHEALEGESDDR